MKQTRQRKKSLSAPSLIGPQGRVTGTPHAPSPAILFLVPKFASHCPGFPAPAVFPESGVRHRGPRGPRAPGRAALPAGEVTGHSYPPGGGRWGQWTSGRGSCPETADLWAGGVREQRPSRTRGVGDSPKSGLGESGHSDPRTRGRPGIVTLRARTRDRPAYRIPWHPPREDLDLSSLL
ncbi:uncharacterized protein LOC143663043 [Tamandua tetradactyla]|uniref:uncharacterized protein LOC143663043 n=1 Tax=Tamandua tetradactyla TaxID=48850 RepID=UPI004053A2FE